MVARTAGRKGRPWRRAQAKVRAQGDTCAWCGHPGATEVDHRVNRVDGGRHTGDNLQVMHGTSCPCPVCGLRCNQVKYHVERKALRAQHTPPPTTSRTW